MESIGRYFALPATLGLIVACSSIKATEYILNFLATSGRNLTKADILQKERKILLCIHAPYLPAIEWVSENCCRLTDKIYIIYNPEFEYHKASPIHSRYTNSYLGPWNLEFTRSSLPFL